MGAEGISEGERSVLEEHVELIDHELDCLLQWITLLNESMQIIWKGSEAAKDIEVFFIKLYGLIAEGQPHIQMQFLPVEVIDLINQKFPDRQYPIEYRQICEQIYSRLGDIQKSVSKDDLEALEYLRNKATHPYIESYRLVFDKNKMPKFKRRGENKKMVRTRIEAHVDSFGGIRSFAFDLIRRLKDLVPGLLACIQIQCVRRGTIGGRIFTAQVNRQSDFV